MKKIYLVRHCEYSNPRNIFPGRLPVELSLEGKEQAKKLADYFSGKKIEKIYSSAVLRCKQTSEIIGNKSISIEYDQRLLETFSAYQGYWFENHDLDWNLFYSHKKELGGEGVEEVRGRMLSFWESLVGKKESNVIICSHGDPLYVLYQFLAGLPLLDDCAKTPNDFQEKGSIREIRWKNGNNCEILPMVEF